MSHIRKYKEELEKIRRYINRLEKDPNDINLISEIMYFLCPKNDEMGCLSYFGLNSTEVDVPTYDPSINCIQIPNSDYRHAFDIDLSAIAPEIPENKKSMLAATYFMYAMMHETEHVYEFSIADDKIPFDVHSIKQGYKDIIESVDPKRLHTINPFKRHKRTKLFRQYCENCDDYILERNASVEALNELLLIEDDKDIKKVLERLYYFFLSIGYDDCMGDLYHTYYDLGLLDKWNIKEEHLTDEDKIRFGLPISNEVHKELVKTFNIDR